MSPRRWFRPLSFVIVTLGIFAFLDTRIALLPPLGPFLNPFAGFWQNNRSMDRLPERLSIPELTSEVTVYWDERRVPHISARNLHDLYLAQGFITARDRLWQMEFQALASGGRLSEFLGESTIEYDRFRRRIGIVAAAEKHLEAFLSDPTIRLIGESYASGVNAWIRRLDAWTLPLEYKILDYAPEEWTPVKSALLLQYFAYTLTFRGDEAAMTRTRAVFGDDVMKTLFPDFQPYMDPVIPSSLHLTSPC